MQNKGSDYIKGALVGGCLGGVAALLLAPKAGAKLRKDIAGGYKNLNATTHEYVDDLQDRASTLKDQACCLIDSLNGTEAETGHRAFIVGSLAGAVLGILAGLLLAPQSGEKLREKLGEEYEEIYHKAKDVADQFSHGRENLESKLEDWKETFSSIIDKFSTPIPKKKGAQAASASFNEIADWASIGLRLYNEVQKRR